MQGSSSLGGAASARGDVDVAAAAWVDLVWYEGRLEHWIRFGRIRAERIQDRRRRQVGFTPGDVFAFVRWRAGDRGTVQSRIDIVRVLGAGVAGSTLPGVRPGGELLLHLGGWPRVQATLQAIDRVELTGLHPADVTPDHWRHVHNRLSAGLAPDPYTLVRHRAWRLRAEITS